MAGGPHVVVGGGSYTPKDPILSVQVQVTTTTRSMADMLAGQAGIIDDASEVWLKPAGAIRVAFAGGADANTGIVLDPAVDPILVIPKSFLATADFYAAGNTYMDVEFFGQTP